MMIRDSGLLFGPPVR